MAISDQEFAQAEERMAALRQAGYAVAAHYDQRAERVVIKLSTDVEIHFPSQLAEGLADASPDELADIEISPSGLGLHWPKLDADLYVPGLLAGQFGSRRWMAQTLGAVGGATRSEAKTAAARENGKKGGRPAKSVAARKPAAAAKSATARKPVVTVRKPVVIGERKSVVTAGKPAASGGAIAAKKLLAAKALATEQKLARIKHLAAKRKTGNTSRPKSKRQALR